MTVLSHLHGAGARVGRRWYGDYHCVAMNAPAVQYAKTDDGWSIAFTVRGEGDPLVFLPFSLSHAQDVWTGSSATALLSTLSQRFRVRYYDSRGQGLSQRGMPSDTSVDSMVSDLRAILDVAGPGPFVLMASNPFAHVAARFAADNPGRVRALVLLHCPVSLSGQIAWVGNLARQNWDYFFSVHAGIPGVDATDVARMTARVNRLKVRTTQDDFLRLCDVFADSDLAAILPRISTPALVLHIPSQGFVSQQESARTAALIPNGRLVVVDSPAFLGEPGEVLTAIEGLLADAAAREAEATPAAPAHTLSPREIEVLRVLAAGKSNQQIADELMISLNTVNRHVSNIYGKTGVANRAEAVSFAHRTGLAG